MKELNRARRVGTTAVCLAVVLRLFAAGVPEILWHRLVKPNIESFLTKKETGRDVRFSSSMGTFSPDFMESPPPLIPEPTEAPIPAFSGSEEVDLYYAVRKNPDIEDLLAKPLTWNLFGEEPTVLILHTHATESYTKSEGESYTESSAYRTLDEAYNMISIGDRVAELLEAGGITVIHDRELHDYPSYNGSYNDARKSMEDYLEEYPTIRLVLDIHRDASSDSSGNQMKTTATVNGKSSAQLMLVMGTNASGLNHPNWQENLALALKLQVQLERTAPGICRYINLRSQRFNQDESTGALLVEVGAAGNTHDEALTAAEVLAQGILALKNGAVTG